MFRTLLRTTDDITPFIARLFLGVFIIPHGLQKTLGIFGGYGFEGTLGFMTGQGIPAALAILAIVTEAVGGFALVLGLFGRFAAAGVAAIMVVAAVVVHRASFFVGQPGGGFELHFVALGLATIVMLNGSGRWSLDRLLAAAPARRQHVSHAVTA